MPPKEKSPATKTSEDKKPTTPKEKKASEELPPKATNNQFDVLDDGEEEEEVEIEGERGAIGQEGGGKERMTIQGAVRTYAGNWRNALDVVITEGQPIEGYIRDSQLPALKLSGLVNSLCGGSTREERDRRGHTIVIALQDLEKSGDATANEIIRRKTKGLGKVDEVINFFDGDVDVLITIITTSIETWEEDDKRGRRGEREDMENMTSNLKASSISVNVTTNKEDEIDKEDKRHLEKLRTKWSRHNNRGDTSTW